MVQQPVAVPIPVPVPAPQLNVNSVYANNPPANLMRAAYPNTQQANLRAAYPNNRQNNLRAAYPNNQAAKAKSVNVPKFNELHSAYYDLESDRYDYKKRYNGKKRFNMVPSAENEAAVKKATDAVEQFLRNLPRDSINYISNDDGGLLSGISFLSIASRFMSSTGVKILCEMGAKTDIIDDSGRSLVEVADADAKRVRKLGVDPTEFMATVKECTASKGGSRTRKAGRKHRHRSRRR
jgi:hypothetical protein